MSTLKVRKIGNSLGVILPKEMGVRNGQELPYQQNGQTIEIDLADVEKEHMQAIVDEALEAYHDGALVKIEDQSAYFASIKADIAKANQGDPK